MKILIDQNLPARLVRSLEPMFPGSTHVNAVGLGGARDIELWNFAVLNQFDIMSRDSDLPMLAVRRVDDVCVVWVRLGNLVLRNLLKAIESSLAEVHQALGTRSLRIIEIR
jgi:predicted nuclease of predicted toxin-antitoxin system